MHQHSFSSQFLNKKSPSAQEGSKEEESQSTSERGYKVRVITQPLPTTPTSTLLMDPIPPAVPIPTVATSTATTQMSVVKAAATSIPVTVYNVVQGKFEGIP